MEKRTDAQARKIVLLCKELNMDDDLRHALVAALTEGRTESTRELTKAEAGRIIDYLTERAGHKKPGSPTGRASAPQVWKIHDLARELGWTDSERLIGFVRKYAQVDRIQWLTALQASNVIEGLKEVLRKERKRRKEVHDVAIPSTGR